MSSTESKSTDKRIRDFLHRKKWIIKQSLTVCVHCSVCAASCFKFCGSGNDPTYVPSYKAINSIGRIFRKKGRLSDGEYEEIKELVWHKCVLCMRCYCPLGISIPSLISYARTVCREKGIDRRYDGSDARRKS